MADKKPSEWSAATIAALSLRLGMWSDILTGAYASASTITATGTNKDVALSQFGLFTCTDSTGNTRKYGFVKSSVNNSGTITHTVVVNAALASGDKDFKISYSRKIYDYAHYVSVPLQITASATESQGLWRLNLPAASKFICSSIAAITPAAGTGAALTWNVYAGATALYSSAPNAGANATLENQIPTTLNIAAGENVSVRITAVGGATNYPANVQVTLFLVPDLDYIAF